MRFFDEKDTLLKDSGLLDRGLITQEHYGSRSNELIGFQFQPLPSSHTHIEFWQFKSYKL